MYLNPTLWGMIDGHWLARRSFPMGMPVHSFLKNDETMNRYGIVICHFTELRFIFFVLFGYSLKSSGLFQVALSRIDPADFFIIFRRILRNLLSQ